MNDVHQIDTIRNLVADSASAHEAVRNAMMYLYEHRKNYHWVGVYVLRDGVLEIGPYFGPITDHLRIQVGQGVCGTAVAENKNQRIADVRNLDNYLACNLETRSELVILIRDPSEKILGQIDVDGTEVNQFTDVEEAFLEAVGKILAPYVKVLAEAPSAE